MSTTSFIVIAGKENSLERVFSFHRNTKDEKKRLHNSC